MEKISNRLEGTIDKIEIKIEIIEQKNAFERNKSSHLGIQPRLAHEIMVLSQSNEDKRRTKKKSNGLKQRGYHL